MFLFDAVYGTSDPQKYGTRVPQIGQQNVSANQALFILYVSGSARNAVRGEIYK